MDRIWRQRIKKILPIAFGKNPPVKNDDNAGVVFAADKAPNALPEFKDSFGQAVAHE